VGGFRAGSAGLLAALTTFGVAGLAAPSYADSTVTVQGTSFPDPARANLSFVGCDDLYRRTDEALAPTVGVGPGTAPSGTRSLGWDLTGGNAVGALFPVDSMLSTQTASIAVNAAGRATGVAYAGYQEPADAGTSLLWLGRSELVTPGGVWHTVDAATRLYTWTKYDMNTRQPVAVDPGGATSVADFAASHGGDGPGLYTIGFGCDDTPFAMDELRVGAPGSVATYDLEALRTVVTISSHAADPRDGVTITGQLRTLTGDPIPNATMILERRAWGSHDWKPVLVARADDGRVRATVQPNETASYRWRFVERPLAEGSTSVPLMLAALPSTPSDPPSPSDPPTSPSTSPPTSAAPSDPPPSTATPADPEPSLSESATQSATEAATQAASAPISPSASGSPAAGADESDAPNRSDSHGAN
jgi:hypothetical protein